MENKVSPTIIRRCVTINQHHSVSCIVVHKACCRVDGKACTSNDQKIRIADRINTPADRFLIQHFLIKYHIGLYNTATFAAGHAVAVLYKLSGVEFAALGAVVAQDTAVEFVDLLAACFLV